MGASRGRGDLILGAKRIHGVRRVRGKQYHVDSNHPETAVGPALETIFGKIRLFWVVPGILPKKCIFWGKSYRPQMCLGMFSGHSRSQKGCTGTVLYLWKAISEGWVRSEVSSCEHIFIVENSQKRQNPMDFAFTYSIDLLFRQITILMFFE